MGSGNGLAPVLIVEDNEALRTSFSAVLHGAGFDVIEAADGFIVLETLKAMSIGAIVLDLGIPVFDGFALLDRLEDSPPVVVVTGRTYDDDVVRRREIFGFVQKPVPSQTLIDLVGDAMGIGRQRPDTIGATQGPGVVPPAPWDRRTGD